MTIANLKCLQTLAVVRRASKIKPARTPKFVPDLISHSVLDTISIMPCRLESWSHDHELKVILFCQLVLCTLFKT